MSRLEKNAPSGGGKRTAAVRGEKTTGISGKLPPRRVKHPSNKQQMTNAFYNLLIVLFVILVAGLFFFGRQITGN
jgi:hypothetical protein